MPTLCQSCGRTSGKCPACIRADAMPMPEAAGFRYLPQKDFHQYVYTSDQALLELAHAAGVDVEPVYTSADIRAARLEGARAAVEVMGKAWRPIGCGLPKENGAIVLACLITRKKQKVHPLQCWQYEPGVHDTETEWVHLDTERACKDKVTHWMPLPQPPAIDAAMEKTDEKR